MRSRPLVLLCLFAPACGGDTTGAASNPVPSINILVPDRATVGAGLLALTIQGSGFVSASVASLGGAARPTTFVDGFNLTMALTAADLATAGAYQVVVTNPSPGGGASAPATFAVDNVVPVITSLSPNPATADPGPLGLTIQGSGFVSSSIASIAFRTGAVDRPTTFVSASALTMALTAGDLAEAGAYQVFVTNPPPGGGTSAPAAFTVNNALPMITSLSPESTTTGSGSTNPDSLGNVLVTINGSGFVASSSPSFNGVARLATFVSGTQLRFALDYNTVAVAGTFPVTVTNPPPGGGASSPANFTIVPACTVLTATIPYNPAGPGFVRHKPVLDNSSVYWYDGSLNTISKNGGAVTPLATGLGGVNEVAVDNANLYWTEESGTGAGAIQSVPKTGGAVTVLASGLPAGSTYDVFAPRGLTLDANYVYWGEITGGGAIRRVPKGGGQVLDIGRGEGGVNWLTLDSAQTYFYFNGGSAGYYRRPLGGGATDTLATAVGSNIVGGIALDASSVYWVDLVNPGSVFRVPIAGGSPVYLVTNLNNPHNVAIDNSYIYYGFSAGPGLGAVYQLPKAGGTATALPYCRPQGVEGPQWIAVDSASVFFIGQSTSNQSLAVLVRQSKQP